MFNFRTFQIKRLMEVEESGESGDSNYKREFQLTGATITGYLELASAEFAALVDGQFGRTYRLFSDNIESDLTVGDRLIEGSDTYEIKGVMTNNDVPGRKLEATLTKFISQS